MARTSILWLLGASFWKATTLVEANGVQGRLSRRYENSSRSDAVCFHLSIPEKKMRTLPSGATSFELPADASFACGYPMSVWGLNRLKPRLVPAQVRPLLSWNTVYAASDGRPSSSPLVIQPSFRSRCSPEPEATQMTPSPVWMI